MNFHLSLHLYTGAVQHLHHKKNQKNLNQRFYIVPVMLKTSADHLTASSFQLLANPICSPGFRSVSVPPSPFCSLGELSSFLVRFWSPYHHCRPIQLSISTQRDTHKRSLRHTHCQHLSPSHTNTHMHENTLSL